MEAAQYTIKIAADRDAPIECQDYICRQGSIETQGFSSGNGLKISLDRDFEVVQIQALCDSGFSAGSMTIPLETLIRLLFPIDTDQVSDD